MKKVNLFIYCLITTFLINFSPLIYADTSSGEIVYTNGDIIKEIAYAYDRQGGQIHYDQATATARRHISASPEDATSQRTIYLDCSSFVNACYIKGFGVNVMPYTTAELRPSTLNYNDYARDNPNNIDVIGYWENADYKTESDRQKLISEVRSQLEVGDVLNYRHQRSNGSSAGHVYIYVGNNTFLHCYAGGSYTANSKNPSLSYDNYDTESTSGQIDTISADTIFNNKTHNRYIFKATDADTVTSFCLIRPFARGLTPTQEALNRMKIAGLDMEKTSSVCENSSVYTNDTITYTTTLKNTTSSEIANVTFTDTIPSGTEFVSSNKCTTTDNQTLSWTGNIPANSTETITYSVKVTENSAGTKIISDSTYVSGVKLGKIVHTLSGYNKTHSLLISNISNEYEKNTFTFDNSLSLAKNLYKDALGINIFENYNTVTDILTEVIDTENLTCHTTTELSKMLVPNLYGGLDVKDGNLKIPDDERTRIIAEDELTIGDIILAEWSGGEIVYVYLGGSKLATIENGIYKTLTIGENVYVAGENILISLFGYDRFAILRPSMIDIEPTISVKNITVTTPPNKLTYYNGEVFDSEGMVITATISNGKTLEVTNYDITPKSLTYPQNQVTINFGELSATLDVTVLNEMKSISISEALNMAEDTYVKVEGLYAGVSHDNTTIGREMLIKDINSDALIAVRSVPYGTFPDYGYSKGDKLCILGTVKTDTRGYSPNKKYIEFSEENGTIDTTIISKNNDITYALDNATTINSWSKMQSYFSNDSIKNYSLVKITGTTYANHYESSNAYRIHKNSSATAISHTRIEGNRNLSLRDISMTQNLGSGWQNTLLPKGNNTGFPGSDTDKTFYALYTGGNAYYYQIVILENDWIIDDYEITGISQDNREAYINIPTTGSYSVVFADYDGSKLQNIEIKPIVVTSVGRITVEREKDFSLGSGDKIMLISDFEDLMPLCDAYIIK